MENLWFLSNFFSLRIQNWQFCICSFLPVEYIKGTDQTVQKHRLICAFYVPVQQNQVFSRGPNNVLFICNHCHLPPTGNCGDIFSKMIALHCGNHLAVISLPLILLVCCFDALHPSQQFFSRVGTISCQPGLNQY